MGNNSIMGNNSPGQIRKRGRAAFDPGTRSSDMCPYAKNDSFRDYWIGGWNEEQEAFLDNLYKERDDEYLHASVIDEINTLDPESSINGLVMYLIKNGFIK